MCQHFIPKHKEESVLSLTASFLSSPSVSRTESRSTVGSDLEEDNIFVDPLSELADALQRVPTLAVVESLAVAETLADEAEDAARMTN